MRYLIKSMFKPLYYYLRDKKEREFVRLYDKYSKFRRYKKIENVGFLNYTVDVPDALSFIWQFREIFVEEIYKFNTETEFPIIYDCGANIGLSCLYFKTIYPKAKIKAFEADPNIAKILKKNLLRNNMTDVEIINKAVWIDNKGIEFNVEGADGGSIKPISENRISIESIRLKDLIEKEEKIDFLKLDVEGAEYEILSDCKEVLENIDKIFVEYHSFRNEPQRLGEILKILEDNGFRYYIASVTKKRTPFTNFKSALQKMDLQLNIFAIKCR